MVSLFFSFENIKIERSRIFWAQSGKGEKQESPPVLVWPAVSVKAEKQGGGYFHIWIWKYKSLPPSLIPTKWDQFFLCLSLIYKGNCTFLPWRMHVKREQWYACPYPSSESTRESFKGGRTGRFREVKNEQEKALWLRSRQPRRSKNRRRQRGRR